MGAIATQLISRDAREQWGAWHLLDTSGSYARTDNKGFNLWFIDANHSWAVSS